MQIIERVFEFLMTLIQTAVAFVVWLYIRKQTKIFRRQADISDNQTEIMKKQTEITDKQAEITAKTDESNKIMTMLTQYANLSDKRAEFWRCLRELYKPFRGYIDDVGLGPLQDSVYSFIEHSVFPPQFCPEAETDLLRFIETHDGEWQKQPAASIIWKFAQGVYRVPVYQDPQLGNIWAKVDDQSFESLWKVRRDLAYFWELWPQILEVCEYLHPDPKELLMLTWLEFAILKKTEDSGRPGKTSLFKLAKAVPPNPSHS